ncbi:hypothetical protein RJT34_31224 [Clitoria ternatea]|uniref:Cell wall protein n=1 Tax=Clitoria ternatea TaxID=43366 RepID=A0AAN9EUM8_CLITE
MGYRASSFLAFVIISNILLVTTWQAVAGRSIGNNDKKLEPELFFKSHGKVHIPGIGLGFPPTFTPQNPFFGGNGGTGTGSGSGRSYVPGGDDTFVPNPGFEVPIPGTGGSVPIPAPHVP